MDEGQIETIDEIKLTMAMKNIKRNVQEGRSCLIVLYYTGARPTEVLNIQGQDVTRDGNYIVVQIKGVKKGLPRPVYLPYKLPLVKEFWNYSRGTFPTMYLFHHFRSKYERLRKGKVYIEVADSLRYHISKWFDGVIPDSITPYFLRHNRFSKLSEAGATLEEMRMIKGSRTFGSIMPYVHMSADLAKKVSRRIK